MQVKTLVVGELQTNCFVIWQSKADSAAVIDPGGDADAIIGVLKKQRLKPQFIILTHGHGDHIGGVKELKKEFPRAYVCVHKLDAQMLEDPGKNLSTSFGLSVDAPEAEKILAEGDIIETGEIKLQVLHVPGHTPGGICLLCRDEKPFILFSGDALFEGSIGRTDLPGGSHHTLIRGIQEKLMSLPDDTLVYPGHGGPTTIGREKKFNPFVMP